MAEARQPWWLWPLLVVLLPLVVVAGALWLMTAVLLQFVVWLTWCSRGRYVLVVYSDSPIWREYFEQNVLPPVGSRGVVLNWSERKQWSYSLPVALFRFFAGGREFNPLAVVFQPLAWPRRFRFYGPFQAFKHGRPQEVEDMRRDLLKLRFTLRPGACCMGFQLRLPMALRRPPNRVQLAEPFVNLVPTGAVLVPSVGL